MRTILLWLLLPICSLAQENAPEPTPERSSFILKIAPLNLVNPYQLSVDGRGELAFSSRWAVDLGIGLVLHSDVFASSKGESYRGLKLEPALKYYTWRSGWRNNYVSIVFKYIDVNNDIFINVSRQGNQYAEWMLQSKHLVTQGAALRFGSQRYVGPRRRLVIEPYVGLGWRQLRVKDDALPPDAVLLEGDDSFIFSRQPGLYKTGDFMVGFYLGWAIGAFR